MRVYSEEVTKVQIRRLILVIIVLVPLGFPPVIVVGVLSVRPLVVHVAVGGLPARDLGGAISVHINDDLRDHSSVT